MDVPRTPATAEMLGGGRSGDTGQWADAPGECPMQPDLSILHVEIPHITQPAFMPTGTASVSLFSRKV